MIEIDLALQIAIDGHKGTYRKGTKCPYVLHCCDVAKRLMNWDVESQAMLCAALLHDTEEDSPEQKCLEKFVEQASYSTVAVKAREFVRYLTNDKTIYSTKEEYILSFFKKPIEVLIIKIADRICNVYDFLYANDDYALKYFQKGSPIFEAMILRKDEIIGYNPIAAVRIEKDYLLLKSCL